MDKKRLLEIRERLSEIEKQAIEKRDLCKDASLEDLANFEKEIDVLENEKRTLEAEKLEIETRQKAADDVAKGEGKEIEKMEEEKMNGLELRSTKLYRDAFFKKLANLEMNAEERAAITTGTTGLALPVETEKQIWNAVYEQHCILNDIKLYQTGTILEVSVHTGITAGKAAKHSEGTAITEETNTFAKITLAGHDFSKLVRISYAAAKMSAGALESYLISEIAEGLGEALAEEVFANIKAKTVSANQITKAKPDFADLMKLLGSCKRVQNLVIYCSNESKYNKIMGMVDSNGQPIFRDGCALGVEVKVDAAAKGEIYALDPKKYIGNMIQPITVESDKDITNQTFVHSGYCRFEGTLVDTESAAFIKAA